MKKVFVILALAMVCAFSARVYYVNNAQYLKLLPNKIIYEKGEVAPLNTGEYYFSSYKLDGYFVKVLEHQILPVKEFLENHNAEQSFLNAKDFPIKSEYVCIVSTEFTYEGKEKASTEKAINLAEFKLVGADYYINPITDFNNLSGFNPKLKGNSVFAITSGKPFSVDLAYLIPDTYESRISLEYFKKSDPKLLVTYYPDESYLKIN